jgi:protein RecA
MSKAVKSLSDAMSAVFGSSRVTHDGVELWLETGFLPLNKAVSGAFAHGLPVGRIIEIFGAESCGKTAIATSAMIGAQQAGGLAMFMDHERSFMPHLAEQAGLCIDESVGNFVHSYPKTFEESLDKVIEVSQLVRDNDLIAKDAPIVVVFDSLAAMVPKSKFSKKNEELGMHDSLALAKACSTSFPVLQHYARELNMMIVVLNQTRTDPGVMFGSNIKTPGGDAKNFYYSVRIGLTRKIIKDKDKKVLGQEITAKVIKNKVSKPFEECRWLFSFRDDGTGYLNALQSSIDYLIDKGVLVTSGAYVEYNGKKLYRSQIADKVIEAGAEESIYNMIRALDDK